MKAVPVFLLIFILNTHAQANSCCDTRAQAINSCQFVQDNNQNPLKKWKLVNQCIVKKMESLPSDELISVSISPSQTGVTELNPENRKMLFSIETKACNQFCEN